MIIFTHKDIPGPRNMETKESAENPIDEQAWIQHKKKENFVE